jgi:hypothetical protein
MPATPTVSTTATETTPAPDPSLRLRYGDVIAIVKTRVADKPNDHRRVAARGTPDTADPSRFYVVFDDQAKNHQWRVLNSSGDVTYVGNDPTQGADYVAFGDKITLANWRSDQEDLLSCRFDSDARIAAIKAFDPASSNPPSFGDWEKWIIQDPDHPDGVPKSNPDGTANEWAFVHRSYPFALETTVSGAPYMARQQSSYLSANVGTDNVPRASATLGDTEKWLVGDAVVADAKPVHYGDIISVIRSDVMSQFSRMSADTSAADIATPPAEGAAPIRFDRSALSDFSRWTIESTSGATDGVKFGDVVYLGIRTYNDPAIPKPVYLQYLNNRAAGARLGAAPASGRREWERWKVADPSSTGSTAHVRYGDEFALQGMSGSGEYLSSSGESGITSATLGATETFTIGDAVTELGGKMPDLPGLPSESDNSAIVLDVGGDLAKTISVGAIGMMPEVGEGAAAVLGFLWPTSGPNIWDAIEARVNALIAENLRQQALKDFDYNRQGLQQTWQQYVQERKPDLLLGMLGDLNTLSAKALNLDHPQQTLPHLVAFATLHLTVLHELFTHSLAYRAGDSDPIADPAFIIQTRRKALKDMIAAYSTKATTMRADALQWRKDLVTAYVEWDQHDHHAYMDDDKFFQANGIFRLSPNAVPYSIDPPGYYPSADDYARVDRYKARMAEAFGSQLDALTLPSLLWRYLDPDSDDVPQRKTATLVTGPFGKLGNAEGKGYYRGYRFWNLPSVKGDIFAEVFGEIGFPAWDPTDAPVPITKITAQSGDLVYMLGVNDAFRLGVQADGNVSLSLGAGERIVSAKGHHGWQCHEVNFATNKGNAMAAGGTFDKTWSAVLPAETHPFLAGISGCASDDGLDQLYLHWQYERWE